MNIFLPYEYDMKRSVRSLDDRRLIKQVLECYQLLRNAIREKNGEEISGYKNHPIYVHYKSNLKFLVEYGFTCCREYQHRFKKHHTLYDYFTSVFFEYDGGQGIIWFQPYYIEGSKGSPNYIRTTENVGKLYQQKLKNKWDLDIQKGRPPKWTNREAPEFYRRSV